MFNFCKKWYIYITILFDVNSSYIALKWYLKCKHTVLCEFLQTLKISIKSMHFTINKTKKNNIF